MTDGAFILALALGTVVLVAMLSISHIASPRRSEREKQPAYAGASEEPELDLFDVTDDESAERATREIRKRIRENSAQEPKKDAVF